MILQCEKRQIRAPARVSDLTEAPVVTAIRDALAATGYFSAPACEISIRVSHEGHVTLRGVVSSYYLKQRAQVAVLSVEGVRSLQNELTVK